MKISTPVSLLALAISIGSLFISLSKEPEPKAQAEQAASAALQAREKEFIKSYRPRFEKLYSDQTVDGKELINKDWDPQTIEELLAP